MNLSHISLFCYMVVAKYAMTEHNVNGFDLCLFRTLCVFIVSVIIALLSGIKFDVE